MFLHKKIGNQRLLQEDMYKNNRLTFWTRLKETKEMKKLQIQRALSDL